ncbi:transcriptional regulator [Plantactinospora siamensis]|uniref:Transcriptional regulator n=1 Tax=Plantactinospora siamensis TaxID=555372 RepID=A0ABV6P239_9ACTN
MRTEWPAMVGDEPDRERLWAAAEDLDSYRVAELIGAAVARWGAPAVWERLCRPLLTGVPDGGAESVAVEHALSEGVRAGFDRVARGDPDRGAGGLPSQGILLTAAEHEGHTLALHALAAALRERGHGNLLLGAQLPWTALADAVRRVRPHTVVVWSHGRHAGATRQLGSLAGAYRWARVFGAGPGWPTSVPAPAGRLRSLAAALAACRPPGAEAGSGGGSCDEDHIRYETVPYRQAEP